MVAPESGQTWTNVGGFDRDTKCLGFDFFTKKTALLVDKWSAAKCAAGKIAVMSLFDGSDSQVYKRNLTDVGKAAIKKALKRRKTLRKQADV